MRNAGDLVDLGGGGPGAFGAVGGGVA
jgi:hypothetical protein